MGSTENKEFGSQEPTWTEEGVERQLRFAFAPIHKRALGLALGTVVGLSISLLTLLDLLMDKEGVVPLSLLAQYFAGYDESVRGVVIGGFWGFVVGAVAGWFLAFARNVFLGLWLLVVRSRNELARTRDFLDHI
jgi:hypothetical protein